MGSRITRSIFKEERSRPIDSKRAQEIRQLTVVFLTFISTLAFFLFGYISRPYSHLDGSISFILVLLLFGIRKYKNSAFDSAPISIILSFLLIFVIIISHFIGIEMLSLKRAFIISIFLFASDSHYHLSPSRDAQAMILWLLYQIGAMGLILSAEVYRAKAKAVSYQGGEQGMLVKVLFSSVGAMAVYLVCLGRNFLKKMKSSNNQEEYYSFGAKESIVEGIACSILLYCCTVTQSQLNLNFIWSIISLLLTILIITVIKSIQLLHGKLWYLAVFLVSSVFLIDFITESEQSIKFYLQLAQAIALNLCIIDGVSKWKTASKQIEFIKPLSFFCSFYFAYLSLNGGAIFQFIPWLLKLLPLLAYIALLILGYYHSRPLYEAVI